VPLLLLLLLLLLRRRLRLRRRRRRRRLRRLWRRLLHWLRLALNSCRTDHLLQLRRRLLLCLLRLRLVLLLLHLRLLRMPQHCCEFIQNLCFGCMLEVLQ
jgi:hypothetical protein